ncbi:MAG: hypothetical protein A2086_09085 [Spirochaetes bacterium GWD1_27_9]|nr:MAG: hypothetical protein A2Z98_00895 [Spirochaetes bacterium GWB1_27_13]OHD23936.1 MAG: hypothetical protein A2Y34_17260 [Spirochaetes bacterium GWC1_27_15]OHD29166.1 MAG: hypothetical protein A2086_09085 [Spirochaetes bacterium GWD1_27_9]
MKKALLIIGHGSRSKEAVETFDKIVNLVKQKTTYDFVCGSHMELSEPSIEKSVLQIMEKDIKYIIVVPYFLYEGNHIKFDIPEILEKIATKYTGLKFKIAKPIGFEPLLADILIKRAEEVE